MNNDAFKNLVRTEAKKGALAGSSKVIARKAVEEEFRKKKKRRRGGGGYASSSDEDGDDDDRQSSKKNSKKQQQQEEDKKKKEDDAKAIEKDLSARYRDRAKERREGKLAATTTDESSTAAAATAAAASNNFLIIPHNIKGLDLELARKERRELQTRYGGGNNNRSTPTATTTTTTKENKDKASTDETEINCSKTRKEMPTMDQAKQILKDFLSLDSSIDNNNDNDNSNYNNNNNNDHDDRSIILRSGMVEYLNEILSWKNFDITSWDGATTTTSDDSGGTTTTAATTGTAAAGKSLQRTKYSLAIDGNPSDPTRAWEIPRQYTLSDGGGGGGIFSSALLTSDVMNRIDAIFRSRNSIRDEMMEERKSISTARGHSQKATDKDNNDNNNKMEDDDDESDDDDIFGGLDD